MYTLSDLIETRSTIINSVQEIDLWPEVNLKPEAIQLLNSLDKVRCIHRHTLELSLTGGNIVIVPFQYFQMAHNAKDYFIALRAYLKTFQLVLNELQDFDKIYLNLLYQREEIDEDHVYADPERVLNTFLSEREFSQESITNFQRFLLDSDFKGNDKKLLNYPNQEIRIRPLAEVFGRYLKESINVPHSAFEEVEKLLFELINDDHLFPLFENDNFLIRVDEVSHTIDFDNKNKIIYGAPGTGKSFKIESELVEVPDKNKFRVSFNPEYTYGQFVGAYKPVMNNEKINYELVMGPFLNALVRAYQVSGQENNEVFLIIEELNRANVSAVFGDVFQLLDRADEGSSRYAINFNEDINKSLRSKEQELGNLQIIKENGKVKIPSNLFIWATMNSADQGVFPLDTAFKRRWSFEYLDIDNGITEIINTKLKIKDSIKLPWADFRKSLNIFLNNKMNVNEDKLLGAFFINKKEMESESAFFGKLLIYLWDDVLRHKNRTEIFKFNSLSKAAAIARKSTNLDDFMRSFFSEAFINEIDWLNE